MSDANKADVLALQVFIVTLIACFGFMIAGYMAAH